MGEDEQTDEQAAAAEQENKLPGGRQGAPATEPGEDGPSEEQAPDAAEGQDGSKTEEVPGQWPSGNEDGGALTEK